MFYWSDAAIQPPPLIAVRQAINLDLAAVQLPKQSGSLRKDVCISYVYRATKQFQGSEVMEQLEQEPSVDEQTARLRQLVNMAACLTAP